MQRLLHCARALLGPTPHGVPKQTDFSWCAEPLIGAGIVWSDVSVAMLRVAVDVDVLPRFYVLSAENLGGVETL